jgi:hypothetical protein
MVSEMRKYAHDILREAAISSHGKNWIVRLPLLVWCGYVLLRYWEDPFYTSIISPLNLGIHELGHLVFSFFGKFMEILGGTLLQVLAPIFGAVNFYRQKDFFSIALSLGWLSTSLFDAARYVGDARVMELPLVSPFGGGDAVIHDWNYLLGRMHLLQFDTTIAFAMKAAATLVMGIGLCAGTWILWQMSIPETEQ